LGTNIAVLLDCSSRLDSVAFLPYLLTYFITTLLPTEHMVPTHSDLLYERAMESQHLVVSSGRARTSQRLILCLQCLPFALQVDLLLQVGLPFVLQVAPLRSSPIFLLAQIS
jgi:hypothetical protein